MAGTPDDNGSEVVPADEIMMGGPGKDGIPALTKPPLLTAAGADVYLTDDDLVLGVVIDGEVRAYPHDILDWHEIINDTIGDTHFAITYCPLTGSGINISRKLNGQETTFGVSGLLYNSNLIPYDRLTDSYWSQMLLTGIEGTFMHDRFETMPVVETTFATWKKMYPETMVVSNNTGIYNWYGDYPYGSYRTDNRLIFGVNNIDDSLQKKERVHGLLVGQSATAFRMRYSAKLRPM